MSFDTLKALLESAQVDQRSAIISLFDELLTRDAVVQHLIFYPNKLDVTIDFQFPENRVSVTNVKKAAKRLNGMFGSISSTRGGQAGVRYEIDLTQEIDEIDTKKIVYSLTKNYPNALDKRWGARIENKF